MNQNYTDIIQQLSQLLLQAIEERESSLCQNVEQLDSELAKLSRPKSFAIALSPLTCCSF